MKKQVKMMAIKVHLNKNKQFQDNKLDIQVHKIHIKVYRHQQMFKNLHNNINSK